MPSQNLIPDVEKPAATNGHQAKSPATEFEELAQRVDRAVSAAQKLESGAQATAMELKDAVEAFHKLGLTHIVRTLKADPRGRELLFELVDEPCVHALFAMHGIIRSDVTARVLQVLEAVRPYMRSHGGDVELVRIEGNTAFVQLHGACNGCSLSSVTLRNGVEEVLKTQVPEITQVSVVPSDPSPALISVDALLADTVKSGWAQGPRVDEVPTGRPMALTLDGVDVVLVNLEGQLAAYRNACAHQGLPIDRGMLDTESCILTCPWHGFRYDALTGECLTASQAQLEPFPLRVDDGFVWIKVA